MEKEEKQCPECGKEFMNLGVHMRVHNGVIKHTVTEEDLKRNPGLGDDVKVGEDIGIPNPDITPGIGEKIISMLEKQTEDIENINRRLKRVETGGKEEFKYGKDTKDIEMARSSRDDLHPKVVQIVDEMLGEDFGVRMDPRKDSPGFEFTLVVPDRLSALPERERPIKDPDSKKGEYFKDEDGVIRMEKYHPEDLRTRVISSTDNFDAIKEHCERVRSFIIMTYQKQRLPVPEFRIKDQMLNV